MNTTHGDVLVLGGGVIGLSCALYLLKAGASVRVLEQGKIGSGSSHGNCGTLTPSHAEPLCAPGMVGKAMHWMFKRDAPLYVNPKPDPARLRWLLGFARHCNRRDFSRGAHARAAILLRSRSLLEEIILGEGLDCEFANDGVMFVYRDPAALDADQSHIDWLQQLQIPVERKSATEVLAMEPALREDIVGGIHHPGDARFRPDRYVDELARRVRELGGAIEEDTPVERFVTAHGGVREVLTTRGRFSADRVVLALGAWSPLLGAKLGLHLPMQPGKGYSITYGPSAHCPRLPLVLHEVSVCVTCWGSGCRLGSTMEFSGYDRSLNGRRLAALERGAALYLRHPIDAAVEEKWWGWRPMSVDDIPIIGPSTRWTNLMLATGHGMMGMSMSAATGELVASLCSGPAPVLDPTPYSPARFRL
ncbi:MAG TPA: FAD-dependent oxidoreductase [Rhodanobacteraceae bacterium]